MKPEPWFVARMGRLAASRPAWKMTELTIEAFWEVLADIPRERLEGAFLAFAAESEDWPVPAALRKLAKRADGPALPPVSDAWDELMRNKLVAGRARYESRPEKLAAIAASIRWSSEAAQRAARAVNFDSDWEGENVGTIRAQFERMYREIGERQASADRESDVRRIADGQRRIGP